MTRSQLLTQQQQLNEQLANFKKIIGDNGEQILLEAISQQRWYSFKNKREIVFDSWTGYLFPNFEYMPHISFDNWEKEKKKYAPNEIGKGLWVSADTVFQRHSEYQFYDYAESSFSFPIKFAGKNNVHMYLYNRGGNYNYVCFSNFCKDGNLKNDARPHMEDYIKAFPLFRILKNDNLLPEYPRLTAHEKSKIIFDYFLEQDWFPNFELHLIPDYFDGGGRFDHFLMWGKSSNFSGKIKLLQFSEFEDIENQDEHNERLAKAQQQCDEYNRIFDAYYQQIQLQKQLITLEQQLAELPEPDSEPTNQFTSDFDYRQEIQNYNLAEISTSVWQYSLSAQQWLNYLLVQIDDWANHHQHLLANAVELNTALAKKNLSSNQFNETEQPLLNTNHQTLQQRLNFSLEPLRSVLLDLLQQNQAIELRLQQTSCLTVLAELETQTRPSFNLLAEHSATLCTQTLRKMEWLESSLDFVKTIVQSEQQNDEDYLNLLDKYQQDLAKPLLNEKRILQY